MNNQDQESLIEVAKAALQSTDDGTLPWTARVKMWQTMNDQFGKAESHLRRALLVYKTAIRCLPWWSDLEIPQTYEEERERYAQTFHTTDELPQWEDYPLSYLNVAKNVMLGITPKNVGQTQWYELSDLLDLAIGIATENRDAKCLAHRIAAKACAVACFDDDEDLWKEIQERRLTESEVDSASWEAHYLASVQCSPNHTRGERVAFWTDWLEQVDEIATTSIDTMIRNLKQT